MTAEIDYFTQNGEIIYFFYNCTTTELLLELVDHQYEVSCYPDYNMYTNQTFIAPQNQDAATMLCTIDAFNNDDGITWAVPCNKISECANGSDETGCEFPSWLIPSLLCGAGAVLFITLFVYLHNSIKSTWKKKMQFRKSNLSIQRSYPSINSEKLYKTAVLIEKGDVDRIHKMYCEEVENNGSEGGATCHLKVMKY